ncbi:MAG: hypothetical protein NXI04_20450 [Planctomycetaceae bacterium]|nr:hypothetical protein [Planctomycetaceae bacterium]
MRSGTGVWVFAILAFTNCPQSCGEIIAYVDNPDPLTNVDRPFVALLSESSWFAAEREANSFGGHLITIRNEAMNAWVNQAFSNFLGTRRSLWIGLNDVDSENDFAWTDGSPSSYRNWFRSEPNNTNGNEDSVLMLPDTGQWNDADGTLSIAFGVAVTAVIPEARTVVLVFLLTCVALGRCWSRRRKANAAR